jgi:hypothetical protein
VGRCARGGWRSFLVVAGGLEVGGRRFGGLGWIEWMGGGGELRVVGGGG